MCLCSGNVERSLAVYHTTGASLAGSAVAIPDPNGIGNVYNHLTVINDTDQDIKVLYKNEYGYDGEFIVPKSIKGFTRHIKAAFDNSSFQVKSMHAASPAVGNITFNLG